MITNEDPRVTFPLLKDMREAAHERVFYNFNYPAKDAMTIYIDYVYS